MFELPNVQQNDEFKRKYTNILENKCPLETNLQFEVMSIMLCRADI